MTPGEHVDGTPLELVEWDHDALRGILEANGYHDRPEVSHDTDRIREELTAITQLEELRNEPQRPWHRLRSWFMDP